MDEVQVLGQTANCYVIGKAGTYIFPACKGVWTEGLSTIPDNMMCSIKGTQIEIIAQDSQSISLTNLTYNPDSKEFSFDVTSINDGNVIVGLTYMENGVKKVEWSWHLWFVTGVNLGTALEGFFDVQSQTMPNGFEMMDRNIGVNINVSNLDLIPGTIKGIYYRYGHRAPYFTDVRTNGNGTKYHGLNESDYSTWNTDKKSVTDPCPPGYRVPASSVWNGNATHEHAEVDLLGYGFIAYRYWNNGTSGLLEFMDDIYYPYPGFVNYVNGSYTISPYESVDNTTTPLNANDYSTFTRTIQTDVTYGPVTSHTFLGSGYNSRTATFTEHIYTEFKYEVKLSTIKGELWASDSHFYKYETKSMGNWDSFAITQCKHAYRSAQREEQQAIAFGRPVGDFAPIVPDYTYGELVEDSTPLTSNSSLPDTSLGTVNNTTWKTALQTNQRNREFTSRGTPVSFTSIPNEGYQVRCVRE
jgi:hypothetical protein